MVKENFSSKLYNSLKFFFFNSLKSFGDVLTAFQMKLEDIKCVSSEEIITSKNNISVFK